MDNIVNEATQPVGYGELLSSVTRHLESVPQELSADTALMTFRKSCGLMNQFSLIPSSILMAEPSRYTQIVAPLQEVRFKCLDMLHPEELARNEVQTFVDDLLLRPGYRRGVGSSVSTEYDDKQKYYYLKHFHADNSGDSEGRQLVESLVVDRGKHLSEAELRKVLDYEDNIYKLHVNIDPEKRVAFIKRLAEEQSRTREISQAFFKDKGRYPTDEEKISAGAILVGVNTWKFRGFETNIPRYDIEGNRFPDFVFYIPKGDRAYTQKEMLKGGLSQIVRGIESTTSEIPRFSELVTGKDRYRHTSLSETQGDGDFKLYLQGVGIIDKYYDKSVNYARRIVPNVTPLPSSLAHSTPLQLAA